MRLRFIIYFTFLFWALSSSANGDGELISGDITYINNNGDTIAFKDLPQAEQNKLNETIDSLMHLRAQDLPTKVDHDSLNKSEIKHPEFIAKFKVARIISVLLIIAFAINIPFYIRWAKQQEGSEEVLLYNVEGKFSYLSIILWIERLEKLYTKPLKKERAKVERLFNIAERGGKSIKIYKRKIHDLLLIKSFGPKMIKTAFRRMDKYSRYTYLLDVFIYLSILYTVICFLAINLHLGLAIVSGIFAGNIIAALTWLILHLIFNGMLKSAAKKEIKAGRGIGMRIIMAQFYGAFGGVMWKDLYYIQGRSSWNLGGGVAKRGFGFKRSTVRYKTGYSAEEIKEETSFDEGENKGFKKK